MNHRKRVWLAVVPFILFIMLAVCIEAGLTGRAEGWAYGEAAEHMSPNMTAVMIGITHIGESATVIAFCLLLTMIPKTRRTIALPVSIAVILSAVLNILLKNIFARNRPDILRLINETSYSFPSGHAMVNASLYTMLGFLTCRFIKNRPVRMALVVLFTVLTLVIGYSRIYLGVHYAGDVLGGWLIGFGVSLIVYKAWKSRMAGKQKGG